MASLSTSPSASVSPLAEDNGGQWGGGLAPGPSRKKGGGLFICLGGPWPASSQIPNSWSQTCGTSVDPLNPWAVSVQRGWVWVRRHTATVDRGSLRGTCGPRGGADRRCSGS